MGLHFISPSYCCITLEKWYKFRYPDDPRLHNEDHLAASVFVRRIEGKRFLYLTGMYAKQLSVYRMKGETEGVTIKLKDLLDKGLS